MNSIRFCWMPIFRYSFARYLPSTHLFHSFSFLHALFSLTQPPCCLYFCEWVSVCLAEINIKDFTSKTNKYNENINSFAEVVIVPLCCSIADKTFWGRYNRLHRHDMFTKSGTNTHTQTHTQREWRVFKIELEKVKS